VARSAAEWLKLISLPVFAARRGGVAVCSQAKNNPDQAN
jgi:hypothetical protein